MEKVKYLILGAGPAGITFANMLKQRGEDSFLVLEKEEQAGGLCRSAMVDGSPFDIGGGHFLDVRRPKVTELVFKFLPETEWALFDRDSRIDIHQTMIGHPLESNIWQLDMESQVEYLASIAKAGCNSGEPMPDKFVDWIRWKLGEKIAQDYMIPYNTKMFAEELDELGTYWLEKLPDVSFEETLKSCLMKKPFGTQPGHAQFYYPKKYGYGEVWLRMAQEVSPKVRYGAQIIELDLNERQVTLKSGEVFEAQVIINTIPWTSYEVIKGISKEMESDISKLRTSAIETRYVPEQLDVNAHWIYVPDMEIPYHRILMRHNFCAESKGYWLETRKERTGMFDETDDNFHYMNEFAYPLNTIEKPEIMRKLLSYCEAKQVYGLGRWGEHSHYNSDVVVEKAMELAERLI